MDRIISLTFIVFFLLFVAYLLISILPPEMLPSIDRERILSENLSRIASEAWSFIKPLLQLVFIILILEYVLSKYGGQIKLASVIGLADIKALLAVMVVAAFCMAALAGSEFSGMLKDVSLVVIGFYFGEVVAGRATSKEKP